MILYTWTCIMHGNLIPCLFFSPCGAYELVQLSDGSHHLQHRTQSQPRLEDRSQPTFAHFYWNIGCELLSLLHFRPFASSNMFPLIFSFLILTFIVILRIFLSMRILASCTLGSSVFFVTQHLVLYNSQVQPLSYKKCSFNREFSIITQHSSSLGPLCPC